MLENFKPDKMSVEELATLPVEALAAAQSMADEAKRDAADFADRLHAALDRRYGDARAAAFAEKGDDTGTVIVSGEAGHVVRCTVPKRVEWDQKLLHAALDRMPVETARHYAKAKFSIDERKYDAAPPDIRATFLPARTVKTGKPVWKIEEAGE